MLAQFGGAVGSAVPTAGAVAAGVASAQQVAARLMQQAAPGASTATPAGGLDVAQPHFEADLEINDFPQHARWKVSTRLAVEAMGLMRKRLFRMCWWHLPRAHAFLSRCVACLSDPASRCVVAKVEFVAVLCITAIKTR